MASSPECKESPSACPSGVVAYTAKLNIKDSYPTHTGVLKFRTVLVNEGEGYNPDTGIFTCPLDGFYQFTLHVSVYGLGQCMIYMNGLEVVSLFYTNLPTKSSQIGSTGAILKLSEGDRVWVQAWGPLRNGIFASEDNDTVFIGFRLG